MRWLVEVSSRGTNEIERLYLDADSWQSALHAARKQRGESGSVGGFSIELLEEGYRAVDPVGRIRFVIRRAPEEAGALPSTSKPLSTPPSAQGAARPGVPSSPPPATGAKVEAPRPAAIKVLSSREQEPTAEAPLTYREYAYAAAEGTTKEAAADLLRAQLRRIEASLERAPRGKLVNLACFDFEFRGTPTRAPLATLTWKDWQGDAIVFFPTMPAKGATVTAASTAVPPTAAAAVPPTAAPRVLPVEVAPPSEPTPTVPPTLPPPGLPTANGGRPNLTPTPKGGVAVKEAEAAPTLLPAKFSAAGAAGATAGPNVVAPAATNLLAPNTLAPNVNPTPAPNVTAPLGLRTADTEAAAPEAKVNAVAPQPANIVGPPDTSADPTAPSFPSAPAVPTRPADAGTPLASVIVAPTPSAPPHVAFPQSVVVSPGVMEAPPPPSGGPPPSSGMVRTPSGRFVRGRTSGDELISALFEAMHDLHFLRDAIDGGLFCLALATEVLPARAALIHFFDIESREWVIACTRGKDTQPLLMARAPESDELLRQAARKRRAVVVADASNLGADRYRHLGGGRSIIVAPIMQAGRTLGAVEILNPLDGMPFTEDEGNAMTYIAEQFAEYLGSRGIVLDSARIRAAAIAP